MRPILACLFALAIPVAGVISNADEEKGRSLDGIVGWLSRFHDGYPLVGVLILLMALDIFSGIVAAFVAKNVSSTTAGTGMIRKVLMLILVGMCAVIEPYAADLPLSKLAAMAFLVVECMSIVENASRAGVPIPDVITNALKIMNREDKPGPPGTTSVNINRAGKVDVHQETSPVVVSGEDVTKVKPDSSILKG